MKKRLSLLLAFVLILTSFQVGSFPGVEAQASPQTVWSNKDIKRIQLNLPAPKQDGIRPMANGGQEMITIQVNTSYTGGTLPFADITPIEMKLSKMDSSLRIVPTGESVQITKTGITAFPNPMPRYDDDGMIIQYFLDIPNSVRYDVNLINLVESGEHGDKTFTLGFMVQQIGSSKITYRWHDSKQPEERAQVTGYYRSSSIGENGVPFQIGKENGETVLRSDWGDQPVISTDDLKVMQQSDADGFFVYLMDMTSNKRQTEGHLVNNDTVYYFETGGDVIQGWTVDLRVLHKLTFDPGEGSFAQEGETDTYQVPQGKSFEGQVPALKAPVGYQFAGWKLNGQTWDPSSPITGDTTVVASYEKAFEDIIPLDPQNPQDKPDGFITVSFLPGENGSLTGTTTYYVNPHAGKTLADLTYPTIVPNVGFAEAETPWLPVKEASTPLTEDMNFTAQYKALESVIEVTDPVHPPEKPNGYVTVSFQPGESGSLSGTTSFYVNPEANIALEELEIPEITPEVGYKLADPAWNPALNEKDVIQSDLSFTAQYEKEEDIISVTDPENPPAKPDGYVTVKFLPGEGGSLDGTTVYYVNPRANRTLGELDRPVIVPKTGFQKASPEWNPAFEADTVIAKDHTFTAQYKSLQDIIPVDPENPQEKPDGYVTVSFTTGEEGRLEGQASFYVNPEAGKTMADITPPSILPNTGYVVTEQKWNPELDPTTAIQTDLSYEAQYVKLNDVIEVTDPQNPPEQPEGYVMVTFLPGDHGTIDGVKKYYVNPNAGKVLGDLTAPTITPNQGYDVADPKWTPEYKLTDPIREDKIFTARYIKRDSVIPVDPADPGTPPPGYATVIFKPGDNGSLTGDTMFYVNTADTLMKDVPAPVIHPNTGYQTVTPAWDPHYDPETPLNQVKVYTFTAKYTKLKDIIEVNPDNPVEKPEGYVTVEFLPGEHGSLENTKTFFINPEAQKTMAEITPPTIVPELGYDVKSPAWLPDIDESLVITSDQNYVAQYEKLDDVISLDPQNPQDKPDGYVTVQFTTGENGSLTGTTTYYVNPEAGKTIADITAPVIHPNTGYVVKTPKWNPALDVTTAIDQDLTYEAQYEKLEDVIAVDPENPQDKPDGYITIQFLPGDQGSLTGTTTFYLNPNAGKTLSDLTIPEIQPNEGYETADVAWNPALDYTTALTEDANYTAQYQKIVYPQAPTVDSVQPGAEKLTGSAEPGMEIIVKDEGGNEIGRGRTDEEGNFTVTLTRPLEPSETLQVLAKNEKGHESQPTPVQVPPNAPTILPMKPGDEVVKGQADPGVTVVIRDKDNNVIGRGTADENGDYRINLDRPLKSSEPIQVVAVDQNEQESPATQDTVAPSAPTVKPVQPGDQSLQGQADPGTTVEVRDSENNIIGSGTVDEEGTFDVQLTRPLDPNEEITVTVQDEHSKTSEPTPVQVPPTKPTVEPVKPGDTQVTVTADPNVEIVVTDETGTVIGRGTTDENGTVQVELNRPLKPGEVISVHAENDKDVPSQAEEVIVPPNVPTVNPVQPGDENVTGTADPGTRVDVKDSEDNVIGTGTVDEEGNYTVDLDRPLKPGETIEVVAKDDQGTESDPKEVIVPPTAPTVNPVQPGDEDITGKGDPGTTVEAKDSEGNVIGTGTVDEEGNYTVDLNRPLKPGETIEVVAKDDQGTESETVHETVPPRTPNVNPVYPGDEQVTGTADPGTTVEVKDSEGNVIGTGTADEEGNYTVDLDRPLKPGETIEVVAKDEENRESEPADVKVPPTAPTVNPVQPGDESVAGKGDPGTTVEVKDSEGHVIGTGTVDEEGNYTVDLNRPLQPNEEITVVAKDEDNKESKPTKAQVPPSTPNVDPVKAGDTEVTVKADPSVTITITDEGGNVIGTGTTDENGAVTIQLTRPLEPGEVISVQAENDKGVPSETKEVTVPITQPTVNPVHPGDEQVTGKADPGLTVDVKDSEGNVIGTGTVDEEGNYTVDLDRPLKPGETIEVVAKDEDNNESEPTNVKVPPTAPTVNPVQPGDEDVTGKGDPGTTVDVKDSEGNVIGTGTVDEEGNYTVDLDRPLKPGETIEVVAKDEDNNESEQTEVKVPPTAPTVNPVQPGDEDVTGKGDPGTTVDVKDSEGNVIGTGTVDEEGNFEVDLDRPLKPGETVEVVAKDEDNNESEPTNVKVPPTAPTVNPVQPGDEDVSGKGDPGTTVDVKDSEGNVIGTGTVDEEGNYTVDLDRPLKPGETIEVVAKDEDNNESEQTEVKVPPTAPTVNPVQPGDEDVTGKGDPGTTVEVRDSEGNVIGTGTVDEEGNFEVDLDRPLKPGETIEVVAKDEDNNESEQTDVKVPPTAPTVNPVQPGDEDVSGKGDPGTTVEVRDSEGNVIGTGTVDEEGNFEVDLDRPLKPGETVEVVAKDEDNNESEQTEVKVPPTAPTVNPVQPGDEDVSGKGDPGTTVDVKDSEGNVIGTGTVDEEGNYTVDLDRPLKPGETIEVVAKDEDNNESEQTEVKVPPTAPTVNPVQPGDEDVSGKGDPGTTVDVKDSEGNVIGTGTVDEEGNYTVDLDRPLKPGETIEVVAKDEDNNESEQTEVKVPPTAPTVNPVQPGDEDVTGKGDPGTTVDVKDSEGNVIGTGTVDEEGNFEVDLDRPLKPGETIEVVAKDEDNNESEPSKITVPEEEPVVKPTQPIVDPVQPGDKDVTGKADPGKEIVIEDENGQEIGKGEADDKGDFRVDLDRPLKPGEEIRIIAKDEKGNESNPIIVIVPEKKPVVPSKPEEPKKPEVPSKPDKPKKPVFGVPSDLAGSTIALLVAFAAYLILEKKKKAVK